MKPTSVAVTRRRFLTGAGAIAAGVAFPGAARLSMASAAGGDQRLVVVILRGAMDGLAAVPAVGDPSYAALRRELAIAAPGAADGALTLDGLFGLHPSLGFLHERYASKELLVLHAVATPYRDRSHFDGQNVLENGLKSPLGSADGWLNRALTSLPRSSTGGTVERAVAISQNVPLILRGDAPVLSKSPVAAPDVDEDLLARLADLYSTDNWFAARLAEATQGETLAEDVTAPKLQATMARVKGAGADRIGAVARLAGQLLRADAGPQIAVIEATGWDTHANQGGAAGTLAGRFQGLDNALRSLADELGPHWPRTAVLVITEFGRTAAVNGTRGTDHGTGSCAFLLGGAVNGGRVIADWPGLGQDALLEHRDLRPTLDLRSVYKAVLADHLRIDSRSLSARIFPDSGNARAMPDLIHA